ncbi:MAG: hypothetical protein OXH70_09695 [Acidobacteria bacterium]|nr:hypothetical protein [Acidobacteriota bacterium]
MDTTNRKAGSATLAACALFLLCVASAGCRGGGTDGAAGLTEASGPGSVVVTIQEQTGFAAKLDVPAAAAAPVQAGDPALLIVEGAVWPLRPCSRCSSSRSSTTWWTAASTR